MNLLDQADTTRLCEIMELAAARSMRPHLRVGESSVSVGMDLQHFSCARSESRLIRAVASQHEVAGRLHHFIVNAFDDRGLIAVAEHTRAVVPGRRLLES